MSSNQSDLYHFLYKANWNRALTILQSGEGQSQAEWIDPHKYTPLHKVCMKRNPPQDVIKALVEANPSAIIAQDCTGFTPLHFAVCAWHDCANLVRILVEANPVAGIIQDIYGDTPLHRAVLYNVSWDVLAVLINASPRALYMMNRSGYAPVLCFFQKHERNILTHLARYVSPLPSAFTSPKQPGPLLDFRGNNIVESAFRLIWAEAHGSVEDFPRVEELCNLLRAAIFSKSCPSYAIELMLMYHPESVRLVGADGMLALHDAASVMLRSTIPPGSYRCMYCNQKRATPSDDSKFIHDSFYFSLRCISCAKSSGETAIYAGGYFKHRIVSSSTSRSHSILQTILSYCPEAANIADGFGRLPLHIALTNGMCWDDGVKDIFKSNPESLYARSPTSFMYPFMIAAVAHSDKTCLPNDDDPKSYYLDQCSTVFNLLMGDPTRIESGLLEFVG